MGFVAFVGFLEFIVLCSEAVLNYMPKVMFFKVLVRHRFLVFLMIHSDGRKE